MTINFYTLVVSSRQWRSGDCTIPSPSSCYIIHYNICLCITQEVSSYYLKHQGVIIDNYNTTRVSSLHCHSTALSIISTCQSATVKNMARRLTFSGNTFAHFIQLFIALPLLLFTTLFFVWRQCFSFITFILRHKRK